MRHQLMTGTAVGLLIVAGVAIPAQARSATTADLSVLHGIPDTPVDVYVDGALTLDDFAPGTLAGPLDLPAGDYELAITAPDAADASAPIIGPITVTLAANTSYTAVAHLDPADAPTATLFTNSTAPTAPGQGRLTVRHTAAAPAVDVLAGGAPVVSGLENPDEATLELPAGTISAAVALAGTTEPVIGPADVAIQDGTHTIVYAIGSAADGTLGLSVQAITGLGTPPAGVESGEAGLFADPDQSVIWVGALALLAGLVAGFAVLRARMAAARR